MLMTSSNPTSRPDRYARTTQSSTNDALAVAVDDARRRMDSALGDLRELLAAGELDSDAARAVEAEYVEVYLVRVAALEQLGAGACTPDEWERYEAEAVARTARRRSAKARRDRLRDELTARQCVVVAPGRVADPFLAALVADEPDAEILEIRAELAAAQLI